MEIQTDLPPNVGRFAVTFEPELIVVQTVVSDPPNEAPSEPTEEVVAGMAEIPAED